MEDDAGPAVHHQRRLHPTRGRVFASITRAEQAEATGECLCEASSFSTDQEDEAQMADCTAHDSHHHL